MAMTLLRLPLSFQHEPILICEEKSVRRRQMPKRLLRAFLYAFSISLVMLIALLMRLKADTEFVNFMLPWGLSYAFIVIFVLYLFFTSNVMKKLINFVNSWAADFAFWKMAIIVICMLIGTTILATVILIIPIAASTT